MLLEEAASFAKTAHLGQLDDEGKDYYTTHILQVVEILKSVTDDPIVLAAAYLHDTIEDTIIGTYGILERMFGKEVADLVMEVTHDGQPDQKGYYFPRLHSQKAIMIKFADRLSNLSRMSSWDQKRKDQYLRKSKFWKSE